MEHGSYKLLIVDDLPKNLMVLGNILMKQNYQIAYAKSGKDALNQAANVDFDLILLDIMMPEMDGFEVCRRLRAEEKTTKTPIIFLTAKNDTDSIVKGFEVGAQDYVTKPFNTNELLARVETHLELKRSRQQVEELNNFLEEKVIERTIELEKANKKIESLDKAKSAFLGLISHEIRTPLNGIIGFIDILKQTIDNENKELIDMTAEAAERLYEFSELSLLITQLNVNSYQMENKNHDFVELLNKVRERILAKWKEFKEIDFKVNLKSVVSIIKLDEILMEKVLYSLIDNAVKFSPEETAFVELNVFNDSGYLICEIHDLGCGFTDEALSYAFEVFSGEKQHDIEGYGLNLAAAKLIIHAHEGKIEVENKPERGAKVCLYLKETF
ncbi:MAG: response regulator [Bacteroidales bacterium]|nr:response regulator [Bacteroidales bacterium]